MDYTEAKKEFINYVNNSDHKHTLYDLYNAFIVEKMKMDKYFSTFLDQNEKSMNECDTFDNDVWKTYRKKLKDYDEVDELIKRTKYYLNKDV